MVIPESKTRDRCSRFAMEVTKEARNIEKTRYFNQKKLRGTNFPNIFLLPMITTGLFVRMKVFDSPKLLLFLFETAEIYVMKREREKKKTKKNMMKDLDMYL